MFAFSKFELPPNPFCLMTICFPKNLPVLPFCGLSLTQSERSSIAKLVSDLR